MRVLHRGLRVEANGLRSRQAGRNPGFARQLQARPHLPPRGHRRAICLPAHACAHRVVQLSRASSVLPHESSGGVFAISTPGNGRSADWRISAQSALDMGLITKVVPPEMILQESMDIARTIASNAPISIRLIKEVLHQSYDLDLESIMRLETDGTLKCYASEDMREGVHAFLEKRAPVFKGK